MSTFFRDAVTDHRFAKLGAIVHDGSDDTAAGSARPKFVSQGSRLRHRATRTVSSRLSPPRSPRCFLESKPLLYNRREQTNLATLSPETLCTRGANDDLVHLCTTVPSQSTHQKIVLLSVRKRHRQRTTPSTTSEFDTLGAPMAFNGSCEHHKLDCAESVPTAQQQSSPD